jgi:predicted lipoprotein with Yx(FWY)xxD motif
MPHIMSGNVVSKFLVVFWLILLSSCSINDSDGRSSNASSVTPAASEPQVNPDLQQAIVTTASGMTVYYHDHDPPSKSYCNNSCEQYWPPLRPPAGFELSDKFSVIKRRDGSLQLAYDGRPLYTFAGDQKPGDTRGDGAKGVWHVLRY